MIKLPFVAEPSYLVKDCKYLLHCTDAGQLSHNMNLNNHVCSFILCGSCFVIYRLAKLADSICPESIIKFNVNKRKKVSIYSLFGICIIRRENVSLSVLFLKPKIDRND